MDNNTYKKYFLRILIVSLLISALVGIFIFLLGDFGETEVRLLFTTLAIGGYSLTGLCSSTIQYRNKLKAFSIVGMVVSVLGFLVTITAIWELIVFNDIWLIMLIFIILSVAIGHISLLLQVRPKTNNIKYALILTIIFISIVGLMLIKMTLNEFDESEFYFRLLGVFSILDVLGTIATPIWNTLQIHKNKTIANN